ncbi:MAG: sulfotransferase [Pseudomonadota bacterium]
MQAEMNQISALFQQGEFEAARKMCRALVQKHPASDKVRYAHAMICQQAGDADAAIAAYEMTVKISPSHLQALANLGGLLVSAGRFDEAISPLLRALQLAPDSAPARYNLAQAYHGQGNLTAALNEALAARALDDNVADIHNFIGLLCDELQNYDEATAAYQRMNELMPEKKGPWLLRVTNLHFNGDFEQAEEVLQQALKHHPDLPEFHAMLSVAKRSPEEEAKSISIIQSALDNGNYGDADQISFLFSLGRLLDRAGDYSQAIQAYHEANRRKKILEPYNSERHEKLTDDIISCFTHSLISQKLSFGDPSLQPVFVVGMPRSGTTLLERLLSSHPDVAGVGELGDFSIQSRRQGHGPDPEPVTPGEAVALAREDVSGLASNFLERLLPLAKGAARAVDSTPGNLFLVGLIKMVFPNATIIHSRRNPIDTGLSMYFQNFKEGNILFANDLSDIVSAFKCHRRLLRHYRDELGLTIPTAQYEEVVNDAPSQISPLFQAMDVDPNQATFDNTSSSDPIRSASIWQARQPVYKTSVEKWRNYEKHIGPLVDGLTDFEY